MNEPPAPLHGLPPPPADAAHAINQRIFETTLDLILVVDRRGTIIRASPSVRRIIGYEPGELVGRSAAMLLHPDDLERTRNEMRLARRGREMRNFDCRYLHRDGTVVPLAWTGVWSDPEQQHFFIGRDMSERNAAEERLRHAQRLESVGQLTGGIAHDFNNLLSVVIGSLDMILAQDGLAPAAAEHARAAMHAAQRGAELTRGLLAFARKQPLSPKATDVNALLANLTRLLGRTLGEAVTLGFAPGAGLWPVLIDSANLESAIANLAVNARDAMPEGGRLLIETANAVLDDDGATASPGAVPGDYVLVTVSDTGSGMPPEVLSRIFDPFFTTKADGTGLGLSMVFGFVKQSGGHIRAYSEVGHGTTFRVYLPRAAVAAVPAPAEPRAASPSTGSERVLVVEDNDAIRQLVLLQLGRLGYRTLEADGAAAALALLDGGAEVDLLFTDVVMPGGMNGHALAREAVLRRPGLRVLFTSGFPGTLLAGTGAAEAVLNKPYRFPDLARKLREVLDA